MRFIFLSRWPAHACIVSRYSFASMISRKKWTTYKLESCKWKLSYITILYGAWRLEIKKHKEINIYGRLCYFHLNFSRFLYCIIRMWLFLRRNEVLYIHSYIYTIVINFITIRPIYCLNETATDYRQFFISTYSSFGKDAALAWVNTHVTLLHAAFRCIECDMFNVQLYFKYI